MRPTTISVQNAPAYDPPAVAAHVTSTDFVPTQARVADWATDVGVVGYVPSSVLPPHPAADVSTDASFGAIMFPTVSDG